MIPKGVRWGLVDVACRNTLIHTSLQRGAGSGRTFQKPFQRFPL